MTFWDRFVLWVYLGMADWVPVPRATAGHIFEQALQRGRLQLASLNDLSVLLLLACAPPNSPVGAAAQADALRRDLPARSRGVSGILRAIARPQPNDLLEVGRAPVKRLRRLVFRVLCDPSASSVLTNLCQFLGWLTLTDPPQPASPGHPPGPARSRIVLPHPARHSRLPGPAVPARPVHDDAEGSAFAPSLAGGTAAGMGRGARPRRGGSARQRPAGPQAQGAGASGTATVRAVERGTDRGRVSGSQPDVDGRPGRPGPGAVLEGGAVEWCDGFSGGVRRSLPSAAFRRFLRDLHFPRKI